jgi:hypothetical protein
VTFRVPEVRFLGRFLAPPSASGLAMTRPAAGLLYSNFGCRGAGTIIAKEPNGSTRHP